MINIDEIRSVAAQVKLSNLVVEKDYALGWLLFGIHRHPIAGKDWIFKGGTCLKKCYLETHRFSEDCVPRKHGGYVNVNLNNQGA